MSLEIQSLQVHINSEILLPAISANIPKGQITTWMGPSGIGKSTLLAAISGALKSPFKMHGQILLEGQRIDQKPMETRQIGVIYQDPLLFPHLNIGQNLTFGMPKQPNRHARMEEALARIGMPDFAERDPATLSGGEAARIALMRALLAKPKALLLDEPFAKLDRARRASIRTLTFETIKAEAIPAILVTHDEEDAIAAQGAIIDLSQL